MKKILTVLVTLILLFALTACSVSVNGSTATVAPRTTATPEAGSALSALIPAGAQNVTSATVSGNPVTYQSKFTYNGNTYTLRMKAAAGIENISGITLTIPESAAVLGGKPQCYLNDYGQGALLWMDGGSVYSLSLESGAAASKLVDTYHAMLFPDGMQAR